MYARMGNLARHGRVARAHRLSGLRGLRGGGVGDIDWSSITQNLITQAGNVAKVAVAPGPLPTYQAITTPGGYSSVTTYGPGGVPQVGTSLGTDFGSLLTSPIALLFGFGLLAVVLMKR